MLGRQDLRSENLDAILRELASEGVVGLRLQAKGLGLPASTLERVLKGGLMTDPVARGIEWAAQKPCGWVDEDHLFEPDA